MKAAPIERRVVWAPLPGSQALALACPCDQILYHGTRGPGKTDAQLMFFKKLVGLGYGHFWRGVIFDKEYKNLDDLVEKSLRWFNQFGDGGDFKLAAKDYKWTWPTGEELLFRQGYREQDYNAYHGHEYPFLGFNELTKQPDRKFYDAMQSCNRSSFLPLEHTPKDQFGKYKTPDGKPLPEIPLVTFSTTNPYGVGHNWVKKDFVDKGPPGRVVRTISRVFNPRSQAFEEVQRTQTHLFGTYRENRYLSPKYIATLDAEKDPNKRKAWLEGDWDIVAGGALDDVFDKKKQVVLRFPIPATWRVDRSFDWGSTKPFSVGWWATADGTEVELPDGRTFCPIKGSFIRIFEYYGCNPNVPNEGLKLGPAFVAVKIKEFEAQLIKQGWIVGTPRPGPADNAINTKPTVEQDSIAKIMADNGVRWTESDKSPGSRKNGLELVRNRLTAVATGEAPGLYFMDNCLAALSTLPVLPRDVNNPDDVDTDAEDHVYDEVRYKVLSGNNRLAVSISAKYPQ